MELYAAKKDQVQGYKQKLEKTTAENEQLKTSLATTTENLESAQSLLSTIAKLVQVARGDIYIYIWLGKEILQSGTGHETALALILFIDIAT